MLVALGYKLLKSKSTAETMGNVIRYSVYRVVTFVQYGTTQGHSFWFGIKQVIV